MGLTTLARVRQGASRLWCRVRHPHAGVMGPLMAAEWQCRECGAKVRTPWAPDGETETVTPTRHTAPVVRRMLALGAAGAVLGVLAAGAVLGFVGGVLWGWVTRDVKVARAVVGRLRLYGKSAQGKVKGA